MLPRYTTPMAIKALLTKKSGLDPIKIALIVLVLALGGYLIWNNWHNHSTTKKQLQAASATTTSTSSSVSSNTQIIFKELGVAIVPDDKLKSLSYSKADVPAGGGSQAAILNLTTPTLMSAYVKCSGKAPSNSANGSFASISKVSGQYPPGATTTDAGYLMKQFDQFYITARYPTGISCTDSAQAQVIKDQWKTLQGALTTDFKSATLVN